MTSPEDNTPRYPGRPDGSTPPDGDPGAPSPMDINPTRPIERSGYDPFGPQNNSHSAEQPGEGAAPTEEGKGYDPSSPLPWPRPAAWGPLPIRIRRPDPEAPYTPLPGVNLPEGDPDRLIPVPGMRGVYHRAGDLAAAEQRSATRFTGEDGDSSPQTGKAARYPDVDVYPDLPEYPEFDDGPIGQHESPKKRSKFQGLLSAVGITSGSTLKDHARFIARDPQAAEHTAHEADETHSPTYEGGYEEDDDLPRGAPQASSYEDDDFSDFSDESYDEDGFDKFGYNRDGDYDFVGTASGKRYRQTPEEYGDYDDADTEPAAADFAVRAGTHNTTPKTPAVPKRRFTQRENRKIDKSFRKIGKAGYADGEDLALRRIHQIEDRAERRATQPKESLSTKAANLKDRMLLRANTTIANGLSGGLQAYLTKGQYEVNQKGEREYVRKLNAKGRLVTAAAVGVIAFGPFKHLLETVTDQVANMTTGINQDTLHQISGNQHGYPPLDPRHVGGGAPTPTPEAPPVDTTAPAPTDTAHVGTGTGTGAHEPNIHETPPPAPHDTSHNGIDTGAHEPTDPAHTGTTAPKTPETTPPQTPDHDPQNLPTDQGHSSTPQEVPSVGDHDHPEIPVDHNGVLKLQLNTEHNSIWSQSEALLKQSHIPVNDHNLSSLSNRIRELSGNLSESQASHLKYGFEITVPDLRDPRLNLIK